jgi:hypothetical protein
MNSPPLHRGPNVLYNGPPRFIGIGLARTGQGRIKNTTNFGAKLLLRVISKLGGVEESKDFFKIAKSNR